MKYAKFGLAMVMAIVVWGGFVFAALDQGWGHSPIATTRDSNAFELAARDIAEQRNSGNVSFVLTEDGLPVADFHLSVGEPVDKRAVFQVASLGKWLTALGVMVLVEEGTVDLDKPVSTYLSRWQFPASDFDASEVTVRRLLSHTAGLTDGLGYDGFDSAADRQTLEASLTKATDAAPGQDGKTIVGTKPGSRWEYSGGGYTLMQLLIEEVSGTSFPEFMRDRVFTPLDMDRTTFDHAKAIELGLAENFRPDGSTEPFRWYTAQAATSLFTTSQDLAIFTSAQAPGSTNPVLSSDAMALMRTPHASEMGADIWGLGVMLYAPNNAGDFIIGHDGSNEPAINTAARFDPMTGDGIVVLATGDPTLATEIAGEWVFWNTGNVDSLTFASRLPIAIATFVAGAITLLFGGILIVWLARRNRRNLARHK